MDYEKHIDQRGTTRDAGEFTTADRATDAYAARRRQIDKLLERLRAEIDHHADYARKEGIDSGHAGDLGHVKELLLDALAFLAQREPEDIKRELKD